MPVMNIDKIKIEKTIRMMYPGEEGYAVPWAVDIFDDGSIYLNLNHTVHDKKGGTVEMYVKRNSSKGGDYTVDFGTINGHGFDLRDVSEKGFGYMGNWEKDFVKIAQYKPGEFLKISNMKTVDEVE